MAAVAAALTLGGLGVAGAQTVVPRTLILQSRTVLRIAPNRPRRPEPPLEWEEHKAAKCQPVRAIAAALTTGERHLDLLMRDGTRLRAKFPKSCRGRDFYAGFYVERSPDGLLCAERDVVRARSGSSCRIDRFRRLTLDD